MEAPERRPAEGLGEVGTRDRELWSRDGGRRRDRDGGRRRTHRGTETKGKGREPERREKDSEGKRGPDERRSRRLREEARKRADGRGGSWPGEAEPGWPSPAWPGLAQPPVTVQLPHLGPTMRSVLPWG